MLKEIKMFLEWVELSWSYMSGYNKLYIIKGIFTNYPKYRKAMNEED